MSGPPAPPTAKALLNDRSPEPLLSGSEDDGLLVARLRRPRSPTPVRIAVIADPHVSTTETGTWKQFQYTRERFSRALRSIEAAQADALVLAGDLTKDGAPSDLDWVEDNLASCAVPQLTVLGNHDVGHQAVADLEARFADGPDPSHRRVGGVDLIGLHSPRSTTAADAGGAAGQVSDEQLASLEPLLQTASEPIVVTHHNLAGLARALDRDGWAPHPPMENATALAELLARYDAPLHVSGHVHLLSLAAQAGVRRLVAPALSSFPQAYLLLDVGPTGTAVRCRSVGTLDALRESYTASMEYSARSRTIAEVNLAALGQLPLVDESRPSPEPSATPPTPGFSP